MWRLKARLGCCRAGLVAAATKKEESQAWSCRGGGGSVQVVAGG